MNIYHKRLLKLAAHLRSGKLGHKRFCFAAINAVADKGYMEGFRELEENGCGTLGCAIGECPVAFPQQWRFTDGRPELRVNPAKPGQFGLCNSWSAAKANAERFFNVDHLEASHLFQPHGQQPNVYGGRDLGPKVKATSVARNIELFVKRKVKEANESSGIFWNNL